MAAHMVVIAFFFNRDALGDISFSQNLDFLAALELYMKYRNSV